MTIKKGTDVYRIDQTECEVYTLVKVNSKDGKLLTAVLEKFLGSPATEDYGDTEPNERCEIVISRYRLPKDVKLVDE